ncbi:ADP-forming succinate--CoA ligase subunit beta [Candidatus Persebacteraceae bacterium Df01]|jgi:succinyl-CoA synthetase beta subunit|uniref:Succinate--CoA ligase [ADP-forming] subunit beta n=1 Tax=Candidatus Doriopsillibacter californiensis TaxID=2970740 RepID=A0ABT7QMD7_9GAMM|nr:ADP-forming succinate--CoA ligase subunit beta [Candidatus Persebacteraceae bacterium Df01]
MKIHEHQAKEIFAHYGITTPKGKACFSLDEAREAICNLNSTVWVIKAQIHAGGRGKGGGVKVAQTREEAEAYAESILGMTLVTHQTGAAGTPVRRLLIEEGANIAAELYMGLVTDRAKQQVALMASSEGGMDIEEVAARTPEKIRKLWINPKHGLDSTAARKIATDIGVPASALNEAVSLMEKLYRLYEETDASLIEINPLVVTDDGGLLALDGKMNFDDNALFRQPNIAALHDPNEEDAMEVQAAKHDLSYISLEGNIGCMVNGAGLAMATMDIIKLCGGEPANFLDVGGGADKEKVAEAFKLMLVNPGIRAILINIFGGIMRCDIIAEGVVAAAREMEIAVPLVVRLEGTNVEQGKKILAESGLAITTASDMADAAQKAVAAAA